MSDLAAFLTARWDQDEQAALDSEKAAPTPWEVADRGWMARLYRADSDRPMFQIEQGDLLEPNPGDLLRHFERHDPARVLRGIAAKRKIVEQYKAAERDWESYCGSGDGYPGAQILRAVSDGLERVIRLLAEPYSDHPDYDEAWRP